MLRAAPPTAYDRRVDATALRTVYDSRLRTHVQEPLPDGVTAEWDGPLLRLRGAGGRGWVLYRDLGGAEGPEVDGLIARQVAYFAEAGEPFEWKLHGHDLPVDLPDRLRAAGLEPEETETVVIAETAAIATEPLLPHGVTLREVDARADLERIAAMEAAVWDDGDDYDPLVDMLAGEIDADPDGISVVVAEAGGEVVCAAWIRLEHGAGFGTLWGGATLPAWRGRGIYRATVAHRASLALERGLPLLETDASDDSRPILERLGFVPVTTTTPWVWTPPRAT